MQTRSQVSHRVELLYQLHRSSVVGAKVHNNNNPKLSEIYCSLKITYYLGPESGLETSNKVKE